MSRLFVSFSSTYFWYFSIHGLTIPFLALFLHYRGFNSLAIGELLAIYTATRIIGPTSWAIFADKTGKQLFVIRLGGFLTLMSFCLLFWVEEYWSIAFALGLFSFFWTSILPQLEVMTNRSIKHSAKIYARIRLWGSLGFFASSLVAGEVIAQYSPEAFTWLGLIVLFMLWFSSLQLKQPRIDNKSFENTGSIFHKIFTKNFIVFFLAGVLLQISFGPYYSFFALYVHDLGYPSYAVGLLMGVGILAEIVIFLILGSLFQRYSLKHLLVASLFLSAIRWYITGSFSESIYWLVFSQCFHAFSFALYHSASIKFLQTHFSVNQQNRAQAIYIAGVYGLGGAIGAYVAGYFWLDGLGAVHSYNIAALFAFLAACIACFLVVVPTQTFIKINRGNKE